MEEIKKPESNINPPFVNLTKLHDNLVKDGYDLPDVKTFSNDLKDSTKRQSLHDNLIKDGYELAAFGNFSQDLGYHDVKKKPTSKSSKSLATDLPLVGKTPSLSAASDQTNISQPDLPSLDEVQNSTSYNLEAIRNIGKKVTISKTEYDTPAPVREVPLSEALNHFGVSPATVGIPQGTPDHAVTKDELGQLDLSLFKIKTKILSPGLSYDELKVQPTDDPYVASVKNAAIGAKVNREAGTTEKYAAGTVKAINQAYQTDFIKPAIGVAQFLEDVSNQTGVVPTKDGKPQRNLSKWIGNVDKYYDEMNQYTPDLPKTVVGGVLGAAGVMPALLSSLALTPEFKAGSIGLMFGTQMAGTSFGNSYNESTAQGKIMREKIPEAVKQGLIGFETGMVMEGLGHLAASVNKGTLGFTKAAIVNGGGFALWNIYDVFAVTGQVDWKSAAANFMFGVATTPKGIEAKGKDIAGTNKQRALQNFFTNNGEAGKLVDHIDTPIVELRAQADKKLEEAGITDDKITVTPNPNGGHDIILNIQPENFTVKDVNAIGEANILTNIADTKAIKADVVEHPETYTDAINSDETLSPQEKQRQIGIINETVTNNNPVNKKSEPIALEIDALNKQIDEINLGTEHKLTKEAKIKPINEQIKLKKAQIDEIVANKGADIPTEIPIETKPIEKPTEPVGDKITATENTDKKLLSLQDEIDAEYKNPTRDLVKIDKLQKAFDELEKKAQKDERDSVFSVPLSEASKAIDKLLKKDKEQPDGYGSFIEKKDANESKSVIEKYSNPKDISDQELKDDFNSALRGNPATWYADGLKLRESMNLATKRGITFDELVKDIEDEFIKDGYDKQTAREVIQGKLKPIMEGATKPIIKSKQLPEPKTTPDELVIKARKGDKEAQNELTKYGLGWEEKPKYRIIGQSEKDLLDKEGKVQSNRNSSNKTDITDNPNYDKVGGEYRVKFKDTPKFDSKMSGSKVMPKNKAEGEFHLEGEYTKDDIESIEPIENKADIIAEINSKPLTHAEGLGMGSNEMEGTYISTEKTNRYSDKAKKVTADVKNPYVFKDSNELIDLQNSVLDKAKEEYIKKHPEAKEDIESAKSFDDDVLASYPDFQDYVAKEVTKELQSKGHDSAYLRETKDSEGMLVVFDKSKVDGITPKVEANPEETKLSQEQETESLLEGGAEQNRKAGVYIKDGVTYTRNEKTEGIRGNEGKVEFTNHETVPFTYKLVEAETLQPSHQGGIRNPNHFVPEMQPKNRNDKGSIAAEFSFANHPRGEKLGESTDAYSGAPVINERNEVVQGNNRGSGLKKGYDVGNKEYRKWLEDNAEKFGLTKEQVQGMKSPILTREIKITDEKGIELGNYDVKDLETGGQRRVNPITTTARMSFNKMGEIADLLFKDDTKTIKEAIRDNAKQVFKIINQYLNPAERNSMIKNGELTPAGIEDIEAIVKQFLYKNGDIDLPDMYEGMTFIQKEAIRKSLPKLLSTDFKNSLISEVQNAIIALNKFKATGLDKFGSWLNQPKLFDDRVPTEIYTPTELKIAELLHSAKDQKEIIAAFSKYTELAKDKEATMFDSERKALSKKEAIKQTFDTEYNDKRKTNDAQTEKTSIGSREKIDGFKGNTGETKTTEKEIRPVVINSKEVVIPKEVTLPENLRLLAEKARKGKLSKSDIFSVATPASLVWDGAIEVFAKTLETTASLIEATQKGLEYIKGTDWYKTHANQKAVEDAFLNSVQDKPLEGFEAAGKTGDEKVGMSKRTFVPMSEYAKEYTYEKISLEGTEKFVDSYIERVTPEKAYDEVIRPIPNVEVAAAFQGVRGRLLEILSDQAVELAKVGKDNAIEVNKIEQLGAIWVREGSKMGQASSVIALFSKLNADYIVSRVDAAKKQVIELKEAGYTQVAKDLVDAKLNSLSHAVEKLEWQIEKLLTKSPAITKTKNERVKREVEAKAQISKGWNTIKKGYAQANSGLPLNNLLEGLGDITAGLIKLGYFKVEDIIERINKEGKENGIDLTEYQKELKGIAEKQLSGENADKIAKLIEKDNAEKIVNEKGEKIQTVKDIYKEFKDGIKKIVADNSTEKELRKEQLTKEFIDKLGLDKKSAEQISKLITDQANKIYKEAVGKLLTTKFGRTAHSMTKEGAALEKLAASVDRGTFDGNFEAFAKGISEKYGLRELTSGEAKSLGEAIRLAKKLSSEGPIGEVVAFQAAKLWESLMPREPLLIRTIKTGLGFGYGNMLSGITTQRANIFPNVVNNVNRPIEKITNPGRWIKWGIKLYNASPKERVDLIKDNPIYGMVESYYVFAKSIETSGAIANRILQKGGTSSGKYSEGNNEKTILTDVPESEKMRYGKYRYKPLMAKVFGKEINLNPAEKLMYVLRMLDAGDRSIQNIAKTEARVKLLREAQRADRKNHGTEEATLLNDIFSDSFYDKMTTDQKKQVDDHLEEVLATYAEGTGIIATKAQRAEQRAFIIEEINNKKYGLTEEQLTSVEIEARKSVFREGGGIFTMLADGMGWMSSLNLAARVFTFPVLPFTKIIGRLGDYSLDYIVGIPRSYGISVTNLLHKAIPKIQSGTSGEKGSESRERQRDRGWFGVAMLTAGAFMFFNNKDNDIYGSMAYDDKDNRKKAYTAKIGNFTFNYSIYPQLMIPFSFLGSLKDAQKAGVFKQSGTEINILDTEDKKQAYATMLMYADAAFKSFAIVKQQSVLSGLDNLITVVQDAIGSKDGVQTTPSLGGFAEPTVAPTDKEHPMPKFAKDMLGIYFKSYTGFVPTRNNLFQQITKFVDPRKRESVTAWDIVSNSLGVQQFTNRTALDIFGREQTAMPGMNQMYYPTAPDPYLDFQETYKVYPQKLDAHAFYKVVENDSLKRVQLNSDQFYELVKENGKQFRNMVDGMKKDTMLMNTGAKTVLYKNGVGGKTGSTVIQNVAKAKWSISTRLALDSLGMRNFQPIQPPQ